VASIGGAGTFDRIFIIGILAARLASLMAPKQLRVSRLKATFRKGEAVGGGLEAAPVPIRRWQ
jgi:hypothetical protein